MRKHAETLRAYKGCKLAIIFSNNFPAFEIETCCTLLERYLHENEALHTPNFYIKTNHFNIVFPMV